MVVEVWLADDMTGNYYMLEAIPDPGPEGLVFGYYADISPAGDKVAYTSCEFPQNVAAGGKYPAVSSEVGPPSANYDIVVGELGKDGRHGVINNTRITNTSRRLDHYPVWSPDGTWIASLSMDRTPTPYELSPKFVLAQYLEVRRADGSSKVPTVLVSTLERFDDRAPSSSGIALIPPVWSPDGRMRRMNFIPRESPTCPCRSRGGTGSERDLSARVRPSSGSPVADDGTNRGLFIAQATRPSSGKWQAIPIAWSRRLKANPD